MSHPTSPYRSALSPLVVLLVSLPLLQVSIRGSSALEKNPPDELGNVLAKMNQVGKNFRSLTTIISQKKYVALLKEFETEETGTLYYGRAKDGSARIRREIARPNRSILIVDAGKATVYEPKINQVRNVNLGKYKDKAEFLAVGIGQSPTKLGETFDIKLLGQEEINGKKTHVLELKPKSVETSAIFTKIILWIDDDRGIPLQQKFIEPSDDFLLIRFSSMRLNAKIPESAFRIRLPKDVEIINQ